MLLSLHHNLLVSLKIKKPIADVLGTHQKAFSLCARLAAQFQAKNTTIFCTSPPPPLRVLKGVFIKVPNNFLVDKRHLKISSKIAQVKASRVFRVINWSKNLF